MGTTKKYQLWVYTTRNTSRKWFESFHTISDARKAVKILANRSENKFKTEDFQGSQIIKTKIAIQWQEYPPKFELWEQIHGLDMNILRTEWSS